MKILVIKLGALGDVINTFPVIVCLKTHFNAEIYWLVAPLSYDLVSNHDAVDKAILFDKKNGYHSLKKVIRQIRSVEYDVAIDFQRTLKSAFFCMAAKTRRRIGFNKKRCKEMTWIFPFERIPESDPSNHMLKQYIEFARYLKVPCDDIKWNIPRFTGSKPELPEKYIIFNIGATKPANHWRPEYFAALADRISGSYDVSIVLTGGKEDQKKAEDIIGKANCTLFDVTGKTSIPQLVETIADACCVISCDTGPMHLAAALDVNLITLFGPSNPKRTGPFKGTVIVKRSDCMPCNKKNCSNPQCMDLITPENVYNELETHLTLC